MRLPRGTDQNDTFRIRDIGEFPLTSIIHNIRRVSEPIKVFLNIG
jgi:hypothetical protein